MTTHEHRFDAGDVVTKRGQTYVIQHRAAPGRDGAPRYVAWPRPAQFRAHSVLLSEPGMRAQTIAPERERELIDRYGVPGSTLADAEKAASGYAMVGDDRQPVDDATLSADIDEMRAELKARAGR